MQGMPPGAMRAGESHTRACGWVGTAAQPSARWKCPSLTQPSACTTSEERERAETCTTWGFFFLSGSQRSCEALQEEQQQSLNIQKQESNELWSILQGSLHLRCPYILLIIRLEGS